jgi:hypothetical protein
VLSAKTCESSRGVETVAELVSGGTAVTEMFAVIARVGSVVPGVTG